MFLVRNNTNGRELWHITDDIQKSSLCGATANEGLWPNVADVDANKLPKDKKLCTRCARLDGRITW